MQRRRRVQRRSSLQPQPQEMQFSGYFPDGVMESILARLPVKSIIRFKAVSKSWRRFLSSPYFVQMQIDHAKIRSRMLLLYSLNSQTMISQISMAGRRNSNSFKVNPVFTPFQLTQFDGGVIEESCDGLVSFKCNSSPTNIVYLWNPATRESKNVELPYIYVNPCSVGIAFVAKANDYKMVRIPNFGFQDSLQHVSNSSDEKKASVWMYSLKFDLWKELKLAFEYGQLVSGHAISVQGCMHWLTNGIGGDGAGHIAAFDVENEVLNYLPLMADHINGNCNKSKLGVIKGSLSLVMALMKGRFDFVYEVWQMSEYGVGSSWRKTASIPRLREEALPLGFYEDGILFFYFKRNEEEVFLYDPFTGFKKHFRLRLCLNTQIVNYTETLASLESGRNKRPQERPLREELYLTAGSTSYGHDSS